MPGRAPLARRRAAPHAPRRPVRGRGRRVPGRRGRAGRRPGPAGRGRAPRGRRRAGSRRSMRPSGGPPGPGSACPTTRCVVAAVSRLVPRKGFDTVIRAARPARTDATPTCSWRSPAGAATAGDSSGWPGPRARRSASSVACPTTTCPPPTAAPTCSPWCAATGGSGWSRRASASSSSRPRPAASRRSPGAAAAPTRPWSTAPPAWSWIPTTRWRSPARWPACSTIPEPAGRWREAGRARARDELSYDRLAEHLRHALDAV